MQFQGRDAEAAPEDLVSTLQKLKGSAPSQPLCGLYFNCLGRGQHLYGKPNHDAQLLSSFFPTLPLLGFFGNAEFGPLRERNWVHNYTRVLVLLSPAGPQPATG